MADATPVHKPSKGKPPEAVPPVGKPGSKTKLPDGTVREDH